MRFPLSQEQKENPHDVALGHTYRRGFQTNQPKFL